MVKTEHFINVFRLDSILLVASDDTILEVKNALKVLDDDPTKLVLFNQSVHDLDYLRSDDLLTLMNCLNSNALPSAFDDFIVFDVTRTVDQMDTVAFLQLLNNVVLD